MTPAARNRQYMQLCWVVPDLEAAIARWVELAGAGPFFLFEDVHFDEGVYRGTPADVAPHRAAIGQHGDMQIELIQPLGDDPGIWRDVVPFGGFGLHHTGLYCEDYEAEKQALLARGSPRLRGPDDGRTDLLSRHCLDPRLHDRTHHRQPRRRAGLRDVPRRRARLGRQRSDPEAGLT
jgi:hypothetical protein